MAGTAAVADVTGKMGAGVAPGLLVAILGSLQLVCDFAGRAKSHEILQKRYYDLLGQVIELSVPTVELCTKLEAEIMRISGDEPPTLRALDAIAYNDALTSMYGNERDQNRMRITWWQSATRHLLPHNGADFPTVAEAKGADA